jgi:CheY-like chemotaxis protein
MLPTKTIMVVDDDDALRDTVCELLQSGGYDVVPAHNGLEALQVCQTLPRRLDLVILDVAMPLMGGVDLAERMRRKRPLRVLFMSGDRRLLEERSARGPSDAAFIQKPFTHDELLLAVRQVLGADA